MIPLHDDNPTTLTPVVTIAVIAACALVFLWQLGLSPQAAQEAVFALGVVPASLFGTRELPPGVSLVAPELTVLTSMFLHGGWMHLIGNMLFMWIFGNNIEDSMGHVRFVVFYLVCGTAAVFAQALPDPGSAVPMIGASGAISGVLGAYIVLFPRAHVLVLIPLGLFTRLVRLPAVLVLGLWFAIQALSGAADTGEAGVAFWAHVGGFVCGAALIPVFRHRRVPLFGGRRRRGPWG